MAAKKKTGKRKGRVVLTPEMQELADKYREIIAVLEDAFAKCDLENIRDQKDVDKLDKDLVVLERALKKIDRIFARRSEPTSKKKAAK